MEVSLFENQTITLSYFGGMGNVTLEDGTIVTAAQSRSATANVRVTAELLDALKSAGFTPTASVGSNLQVTLTIGFPSGAGPGSNEGYLDAQITNHQMLTSNCPATSAGTEISVTIDCIKETNQTGYSFVPADPTYSFRIIYDEGPAKQRFKVSSDGNGGEWNTTLWMEDRNQYYYGQQTVWIVVCSSKLILSTYQGPDPSVSDHLVLNRRMLIEELHTDVVVLTKNKSEVKFHRSIMAAHSSVFNSMFQSGLAEAQSGIVEMPDMTEESVRALREYLYIWKLSVPLENSQVCFELLEAGHKYDIAPLEKSMKKILLQKHHDWYAVDVALRLFLFVRGQEDEELKIKAVRVLRAKYEELKELSSYQELFKKNTTAAMDLCECLAKHL